MENDIKTKLSLAPWDATQLSDLTLTFNLSAPAPPASLLCPEGDGPPLHLKFPYPQVFPDLTGSLGFQ